MQTAKERPILDESPRKYAIEVLAHGARADGHAQLEVMDRASRPDCETVPTKQGVRVEAAKIECERLARQIGVTRVRPLLPRRHVDDLTGRSEQSSAQRIRLACEHNGFDGLAGNDVVALDLVRARILRPRPSKRYKAEPGSVARDKRRAGAPCRAQHGLTTLPSFR